MKHMNFDEFRKQFDENNYDTYNVKLHLKDVAGGIPCDPNLTESWINATNKNKSAEERAKIVMATKEELPALTEEAETAGRTVFKVDKDTGRIYIEGRCLKAALKESANIVKSLVSNTKKCTDDETKAATRGVAGLKSKIADRVFVVEEKIFFERNGEFLTKEDETNEQPIHVMTPMGERSSIKLTDIVRNVTIKFTVRMLRTPEVTEEALFSCLSYIPQLGVGSSRSQGHGISDNIEVEFLKVA